MLHRPPHAYSRILLHIINKAYYYFGASTQNNQELEQFQGISPPRRDMCGNNELLLGFWTRVHK